MSFWGLQEDAAVGVGLLAVLCCFGLFTLVFVCVYLQLDKCSRAKEEDQKKKESGGEQMENLVEAESKLFTIEDEEDLESQF